MLVSLSIKDMLLIERVELGFRAGLNVLTGETGAGKSILLDSLGFVLGRRGRAGMVRQGAAMAEVIAVFELPMEHAVAHILEEAGLPFDGQLILRRLNYPDGRKRGFVNDRACSTEVLHALGVALVEVHGQQDDRGLLDAKAHRNLLDSYAGNEALLARVSKAWQALALAEKELQAAQDEITAAKKDAEYLEHAVRELEALAPQAGEDDALDKQRRHMQAADRVREDVSKAAAAQSVAESQLHDALRWLQDSAQNPDLGLDAPLDAMSRVLIELQEVQQGVEAALVRLDIDPYDLEQVEERLFALRAMARKHKVLPDELPALLLDMQGRMQGISEGDSRIAGLAAQRERALDVYNAAADTLHQNRLKFAKRLDKAMHAELVPLKMENAVFKTVVAPASPRVSGKDEVSFRVSTNPGAPAGDIGKIASGGELSRFLLALKVCLSTRSAGLTLVFDEIDRGVGGATADAVGRRLVAVARDAQVLVVTHSPQVAAMGQGHYLVSKSVSQGQTRTDVSELSAPERLNEIARMLAGEVVSDAARAAAAALLASAGTP